MSRLFAALSTVPRFEREQWDQLSLVLRFAVSARLSVLVMTGASAGIGGLLALSDRQFDPLPWFLCLLGLLFAHATSNLVNDLVDFRRGVDDADYPRARYGTHVLLSGLLPQPMLLRYVAASGAIALVLGIAIALLRGPLIWPLMAAGALLLLFYTWPLKQWGLGEPAVLLTWGPLMVGGSYFVASGQWSWPVFWLSLVYAIGPTTVLLGKHVDKLEMDSAKGIRTVPVRLGRDRSLRLVQLLFCAQPLLILALILTGLATPWLLLLALALPALNKSLPFFSRPAPKEPPQGYPMQLWPLWYTHKAFQLNRSLSGYFLIALLLGAVLPL